MPVWSSSSVSYGPLSVAPTWKAPPLSMAPLPARKSHCLPVVDCCASRLPPARLMPLPAKLNAAARAVIAILRPVRSMTNWRPPMNSTDKEALRIAYQLVIKGADKAQAKQLIEMAAEEGWEAAAEWAAFHLQYANLALRPWECAPCHATPGRRDPASRLLDKMLAMGFSRWHHDPAEVVVGARPETGDRNTGNR